MTGTTSIIDNAGLVKRVPVPREVVPVAAVLSNCVHLLIQVALLLVIAFAFGMHVGTQWVWLPLMWLLYVIFVCGLALGASAINVFIRDTRYVVESFNLVLFWLVPIFYSFNIIQKKYQPVYNFNPVAAMVMAMRNILLENIPPAHSLVMNMLIAACAVAGSRHRHVPPAEIAFFRPHLMSCALRFEHVTKTFPHRAGQMLLRDRLRQLLRPAPRTRA